MSKTCCYKSLYLVLFCAIMAACTGLTKVGTKEELIATDKAFSQLSEEKGMQYAFLEYAAEDVVMLRKNKLPIEGKNALIETFKTFSDTGFILTWEPLFADIAKSGELGYTYGIYTSVSEGPNGTTNESKGTYVSIWKKDQAGQWKFVLDTGNEGIGEQL